MGMTVSSNRCIVCCITDGTATDVYCNVTIGVITIILNELTMQRIVRIKVVEAHGGHTTTTIY